MKMPNKSHGGKRAGAGRRAHDEKPIPVTVTLPPSVIAELKKINPNLSAAIRTLVACQLRD